MNLGRDRLRQRRFRPRRAEGLPFGQDCRGTAVPCRRGAAAATGRTADLTGEAVRPVCAAHVQAALLAVLEDLAFHKGMTLSECLEETLLHSFEQTAGGVASPHVPEDFDVIEDLKTRHGLDYDTHATYRFVEEDVGEERKS